MVMSKGAMLADCGFWTGEILSRASRWLDNFSPEEQRLANVLLDGFLYFSDRQATELMASGFHNLSNILRTPGISGPDARDSWTKFFDTAYVTIVEDDLAPSVTDSGYEAARKLRYKAGFPESRSIQPLQALELAAQGKINHLVFVDDFVGTGTQFIDGWQLSRSLPGGGSVSFEEISQSRKDFKGYYCPSLCTSYGLGRILSECKGVTVSPGAVLSERYNVLHPESVIWPEELRAEGQAFVTEVSKRFSLPSNKTQYDWRGYHALGLAVAIRDMMPDANLAIFRADNTWTPINWTPLVVKR